MAKAGREKFMQAMLMFFAALLTFGGPTYLLYILQELAFPRLISILLGLASFTMGIILFTYLLKGEGKVGAST